MQRFKKILLAVTLFVGLIPLINIDLNAQVMSNKLIMEDNGIVINFYTETLKYDIATDVLSYDINLDLAASDPVQVARINSYITQITENQLGYNLKKISTEESINEFLSGNIVTKKIDTVISSGAFTIDSNITLEFGLSSSTRPVIDGLDIANFNLGSYTLSDIAQ